MWPYPWTHVGTPSHLGHMDRLAATMPSQAHAGAAQEAPDIGQWEGQDVPLVRPSSCNVKGGIPSSRRYLPTYLPLFGRDPLGRGLPLSGDGMAMDAKECFAQQEPTARDIRQQLEKEHAERQKSAPSSTAQKFRVGDPVWVIRPRPMGTHRTKTWFTPGEVVRRIGEDTYRIKVGHGQFRERHESQLRVREPDLRG